MRNIPSNGVHYSLRDGVYYGVVSSDTSQGFKSETVKVVVIR